MFLKGSQSRTISINAQYQVLFRNPRDSLQISILARQLCPLNSKNFLEIYKRAMHRAYMLDMVIYFAVLHNFAQMKFVIVQTFYFVNILLSCISFNFVLFLI